MAPLDLHTNESPGNPVKTQALTQEFRAAPETFVRFFQVPQCCRGCWPQNEALNSKAVRDTELLLALQKGVGDRAGLGRGVPSSRRFRKLLREAAQDTDLRAEF